IQGVHITLFFLCLSVIISKRRKRRADWAQLGYICTLFVLGTMGNALGARWCEMLFIDDVSYPGGPVAFNTEESSNIITVLGDCVYIVNLWLQDGLLLYRFFVIFRKSYYAMILPTTAFAVTMVLGSLLMASIANPENSFYSGSAFELALAYWSLSIGYTAIMTLAITTRLMYLRWKMKQTLGSDALSQPYVSVSAMLIEGAALYTINGLIFIVSFGLNSNIQNLAIELLGQTQSIAPLMIIYRLLRGQA
ncbi:hypothetical protein CONPUDRAFT_22219, partial [Coniophora puteana RWD-64-598 SS2]